MRTITIRQLSINLFKELEDLPVLVTRYGKPYCVISKPENSKEDHEKPFVIQKGILPENADKESIENTFKRGELNQFISLVKKLEKDKAFIKPRGEMNLEDYV